MKFKYVHAVEYYNIKTRDYSFSRYFSSEKKAKKDITETVKPYGIEPKFTYLPVSDLTYITDQNASQFYRNIEYRKDRTCYPVAIIKKIVE